MQKVIFTCKKAIAHFEDKEAHFWKDGDHLNMHVGKFHFRPPYIDELFFNTVWVRIAQPYSLNGCAYGVIDRHYGPSLGCLGSRFWLSMYQLGPWVIDELVYESNGFGQAYVYTGNDGSVILRFTNEAFLNSLPKYVRYIDSRIAHDSAQSDRAVFRVQYDVMDSALHIGGTFSLALKQPKEKFCGTYQI